MKAAVIHRFGPASEFVVEKVPDPVIQQPDQVLLDVHRASVNPIDWKTRKGNLRLLLGFRFPKILGYDVSGVVIDKGAEVENFEIGDRVFCRLDNRQGGAYAERAVASEKVLAKIPDELSDEEAAAIPLAGLTALQGLRDHGKIQSGKRVFISGGAGGVGYFAVQIAKIYGAHVTVVCSDRTLSIVEDLKPDKIYNYQKTDIHSQNDSYDLIFDTVGAYPYNKMSAQLARGGVYVTTLPRPKVIWHKVMGLFRNHSVKTFLMDSIAADCKWMADHVVKGELNVLIDSTHPLDQTALAHERSESGRARGKIIIRIK